nr:hypothetical protein [Arenimonas sp.]
ASDHCDLADASVWAAVPRGDKRSAWVMAVWAAESSITGASAAKTVALDSKNSNAVWIFKVDNVISIFGQMEALRLLL